MSAQPGSGDQAPPKSNDPADADRDEREYSTQSDPDQPPPVADERARQIAETSPEGIPADPSSNPRKTIGLLLFVAVALLLGVAVAVAIFADRWLGLGIGVIGLLLLVVNPVLWASILRMKEREES